MPGNACRRLLQSCFDRSCIFAPRKRWKKRRVASALQQTSIRRHFLVRLGTHPHIQALFPMGSPSAIWPSPLQLFSCQYTTAGKHVDVDLCFFLRVAGITLIFVRHSYHEVHVSPCFPLVLSCTSTATGYPSSRLVLSQHVLPQQTTFVSFQITRHDTAKQVMRRAGAH